MTARPDASMPVDDPQFHYALVVAGMLLIVAMLVALCWMGNPEPALPDCPTNHAPHVVRCAP